MNKLFSVKISNYLVILTLLLLNIPILLPLTHPGFFPLQDFISVPRVYEMDVALRDGHFPVRWAKDFRYGEPVYNFYAPLPYYVGGILKIKAGLLGFPLGYLDVTKILFGLSFVLSTLAMYLLAQNIFGKLGGILASALYLYAPYHSVDVYVRGALSESWALIFFPLIFYFSKQLARHITFRNIALLSLSLAGLFYTHNIMTMLFMPFALMWMGFWVLSLPKEKRLKLVAVYFTSIAWAAGIAASFLLPALFEKPYVQTEKLINGYFNFRGHFIELRQFFSTFWGYGASVWGGDDGMSFQVGLSNWLFLLISGLTLFVFQFKRLLKKEIASFFGLLLLMFLFSLFMQHNKSAFIWEKIPLLWYTQFPWRFLGVSIFLAALAGTFFFKFLAQKLQPVVLFLAVALTVGLGVGYFHPESYYLDSQDSHYVSKEVLAKEDKLPKDYLPIWVKKIEPQKFYSPKVVYGQATLYNYQEKTAQAQFNIISEKEVLVEMPLTYFPGWKAYLNGSEVPIEKPTDLGLIDLKIPPGSFNVSLAFTDTPIRQIGNILSAASFAALLLLFVFRRYHQNYDRVV